MVPLQSDMTGLEGYCELEDRRCDQSCDLLDRAEEASNNSSEKSQELRA